MPPPTLQIPPPALQILPGGWSINCKTTLPWQGGIDSALHYQYLVADGEVHQVMSSNWLMAQSSPSTEVCRTSDQLPFTILVQTVPELLKPSQCPRDLEPILDGLRNIPGVLVFFTPSAPIHHTCERLIQFLVIPENITKLENTQNAGKEESKWQYWLKIFHLHILAHVPQVKCIQFNVYMYQTSPTGLQVTN